MPRLITPYADYPQSGKSTMAQYLEEKYGYKRISIATPIKRAVSAIITAACDPMAMEELERRKDEPLLKVCGMTPRDLMITIGSAAREKEPDVWARICCAYIRYNLDCGRSVVVDDMRFPNEWEMFKQFNHIPVKIIKPTHGEPNEMEGLLAGYTPDHVFKVEDGSHDKLYQLTDTLMERLK